MTKSEALTKIKLENSIRNFPDELRDDFDVVMAAISNDGLELIYASDRLRDDKTIVLAAVNEGGDALQYASPRLKDDKAVVLVAAINKDDNILKIASKKNQDDKEIVLAAVSNNGTGLQYASQRFLSPRLRSDKDVVFAAIQNNPLAKQFADNSFQENQDVKTSVISEKLEEPSKDLTELLAQFKEVKALYQKYETALKQAQTQISTVLK